MPRAGRSTVLLCVVQAQLQVLEQRALEYVCVPIPELFAYLEEHIRHVAGGEQKTLYHAGQKPRPCLGSPLHVRLLGATLHDAERTHSLGG